MFKTILLVAFTGLSTTAAAGTSCPNEATKLVQCTTSNLSQIGNVSAIDNATLLNLVERQCGWQMRLMSLCGSDQALAVEIVQFQIIAFKANSTPSK